MAYVVLARKWRPMSFADLVGQDHVATTLANAIAADRVAHAFLFTGVRGVGKTTSARILAKALNCMNAEGPTASPCLECSACREIATGQDMDVQEIDGASYNGVEEVRKLQDSLPYRPSRDRYKVIIVDEVHMLSTAAWNAFLKTLEEPPPHVKFIFATTEAHKVPVTILSRVQRFDFKLISTQTIATRLRHVLKEEGVAADDEALGILAREAAGSMRDAMSLLDQVIAFGGEQLTGQEVARVLGVASRQVLHDICGALVDGEAATCLSLIGSVAEQGHDIGHVARDVLALLRDLVVARVCTGADASQQLLDLSDTERADVEALAGRATVDDLLRLHQGFATGYDDVVRSDQPRAALEMLLVRLARRPPLLPVDALLDRLEQLERRLSGSRGSTPGNRTGGGGGGARRGPPGGPVHHREPLDQPPGLGGGRTETAPLRGATARQPRNPAAAPGPADGRDEPPPEFPPFPEPAAPDGDDGAPVLVAQLPPEPPRRVPEGLDGYRAFIEVVREARPDHAAFLEHAGLLTFDPEAVVLGFEPGNIFGNEIAATEVRTQLEAKLRHFFAAQPAGAASPTSTPTTTLTIEVECTAATELENLARIAKREREERLREARERARRHPLVEAAIDVLGARLREIRLPEA